MTLLIKLFVAGAPFRSQYCKWFPWFSGCQCVCATTHQPRNSVPKKILMKTKKNSPNSAFHGHFKYEIKKEDVEFYDSLEDVAVTYKYKVSWPPITSLWGLNDGIRKIAERNKRYKTIFVIDEFLVRENQDWNCYEFQENVDVILAFHPRKDSQYKLTLPSSDDRLFCCKLTTMYRNSFEVLRLCSFISSHSSHSMEESLSETMHPISQKDDSEDFKNMLPQGETPTWIELESTNIHPVTVFKYIQRKYVKENFCRLENVSFINDDSQAHSEQVRKWPHSNNYHIHSSSDFGKRSFSFEHFFRGLEWELSKFKLNVK